MITIYCDRLSSLSGKSTAFGMYLSSMEFNLYHFNDTKCSIRARSPFTLRSGIYMQTTHSPPILRRTVFLLFLQLVLQRLFPISSSSRCMNIQLLATLQLYDPPSAGIHPSISSIVGYLEQSQVAAALCRPTSRHPVRPMHPKVILARASKPRMEPFPPG